MTAEMDAMREEQAQLAATEQASVADVFRGIYLWPMIIASVMMVAQQFSGINATMFFSTSIFEGAGMGSNAVYATLVMGFVNVVTTMLSVYLVRFCSFYANSLKKTSYFILTLSLPYV